MKTVEEREELFPHVIRAAACVSVAIRSPGTIDRRGLHVNNISALTECMHEVAREETACLVDGFRLPSCEIDHLAVIGGDSRSAAIAAASVIAKVTRDRFMHRAAAVYDRWNFAGNVGYSTPDHRDAILEHEICPLHRRSFASVAYSQLELGEEGPGIDELGLAAPGREAEEAAFMSSEGMADVIDIREAIAAEGDPDDVESVAENS
jgi:ribonuclease HII